MGLRNVLPCLRHHGIRVPRLDSVSMYSATRCDAAKLIVQLVSMWCGDAYPDATIWDAFGGSGSDAIAFLLSGARHVTATELHVQRALAMRQRVRAYMQDAGIPASRARIFVGDSLECMQVADVIYMDPPWGGPDYKTHEAVTIQLGGKLLGAHMSSFRRHARTLIVLKLPYNYDYTADNRVLPAAARRYTIQKDNKDRAEFDLVVIPTASRVMAPPPLLRLVSGRYTLQEKNGVATRAPRRASLLETRLPLENARGR